MYFFDGFLLRFCNFLQDACLGLGFYKRKKAACFWSCKEIG